MNTLSPYKNEATFVASFFQGKVKELRKKYPSITVLQLKTEKNTIVSTEKAIIFLSILVLFNGYFNLFDSFFIDSLNGKTAFFEIYFLPFLREIT